VPLLLEGAVVVTLDDEMRVGRYTIAVERGKIAAVLDPTVARARYRGAARVPCRGRLAMPGLVNAHLHPDLHILKGALEGLALHDWGTSRALNGALRALNGNGGQALQRAAVRASLIDAALGGTTCVATYGVTVGSEAICAEALLELGLRGAVTIRDPAFPARLRGLPDAANHGLRGPLRFYRLHAEEALDEAELRAAAAAHDAGAHLVMHAAETRTRIDIMRAAFGTTTIRLLQRRGLLSPRMLLSHAIHVDAEERGMIATAGAPVVASPAAELKLGDGFGPFVEYIAAGVPLALGTDAAVCNNGTDMFLECRLLGLAQQAAHGPAALTPEQILLCATRHGARALGCDRSFGAIAPGLAADIILLDLASPRLQPLVWQGRHRNVYANLVYAATGQDVTDVMVGGEWIVRRRRFVRADARSAWRDLATAATTLYRRIDEANGSES
jgi:5-methylthioadenosine/S-adenosylhomocysteine deaminase